MRFSLQLRYAIAGLFDLAFNGQGDPVQVRVIGERQGIPNRYLEQIFQRLRRAHLVSGRRGPGGGYVLARRPAEIRLRDVVEAIEGPIGLEAPAGRDSATPEGSDPLDFVWSGLAERIAGVLAAETLEDVCRSAAERGIPRSNADTYIYEI